MKILSELISRIGARTALFEISKFLRSENKKSLFIKNFEIFLHSFQ